MASRILIAAGLGAAVLAGALPAFAQAKKPVAQVTVTNQRTVPLTAFEIATASEQPVLVAKLAKPLAPGKSATLRLTKAKGCAYTVQGVFADESETGGDMDFCRERVIRLTE